MHVRGCKLGKCVENLAGEFVRGKTIHTMNFIVYCYCSCLQSSIMKEGENKNFPGLLKHEMGNGWFQKYPYHITDGIKILTLAFLWKFQNALPPRYPLNSKMFLSILYFPFFLLQSSVTIIRLPMTSNDRDFMLLHLPRSLAMVYRTSNCDLYNYMHLWLK